MYYSDSDVMDLINRIEKPYETEVIELKEARRDFSFKETLINCFRPDPCRAAMPGTEAEEGAVTCVDEAEDSGARLGAETGGMN